MPLPEHLTPAENLFNRAARTLNPSMGPVFTVARLQIYTIRPFSPSLYPDILA